MIKIPKGTRDVLPKDSCKWQFVEEKIRELARIYSLNEIRTPIFEHTELFLRGVGDTTDIVNKEMYTFLDKGDRSITLKPEGTASVARAFIESGLDSSATFPVKMYYITPVFRYERPQSGRLREHHQFGVEIYGSLTAYTDAEVITIAHGMLAKLEVADVKLYINNIGCGECRKEYNKALTEYFRNHIDYMCPLCRERLVKNPLRILDCKDEKCKVINASAPVVLDYLCEDCSTHFDTLQKVLDMSNIEYYINPRIVRGLDYYTGTVFEFVTDSGLTVCGGGRYNNLITELDGRPTPAVGFGMGIERLLTVAGKVLNAVVPNVPKVYIAPLESVYLDAYSLVNDLRCAGIRVDTDHIGRSLKAQMKYADKLQVEYLIVLGSDEIACGCVKVKNMIDGTVDEVRLDNLVAYFVED